MKSSVCVFPNPNPFGIMPINVDDDFQLSDYLLIHQDCYNLDDQNSTYDLASQNMVMMKSHQHNTIMTDQPNDIPTSRPTKINHTSTGVMMKKKVLDKGLKIAFRTKSTLEIMDDGYKWRKYGKKKVKNSPNPRNYFKCSSGGCNVKKRVERDGDDSCYVITTYVGVHNHESPCFVVSQMPSMGPIQQHQWNLQDSYTYQYSSSSQCDFSS